MKTTTIALTVAMLSFVGVEARTPLDAGSAPKEPTKVVFFFDTEDFIQPRSADAIRDMANVLASEGVKGHFAMVCYRWTYCDGLRQKSKIEAAGFAARMPLWGERLA